MNFFQSFIVIWRGPLYVVVLFIWWFLPEPFKSIWQRMMVVVEDRINHF